LTWISRRLNEKLWSSLSSQIRLECARDQRLQPSNSDHLYMGQRIPPVPACSTALFSFCFSNVCLRRLVEPQSLIYYANESREKNSCRWPLIAKHDVGKIRWRILMKPSYIIHLTQFEETKKEKKKFSYSNFAKENQTWLIRFT